MIRGEISEYPYHGTIKRVTAGTAITDDTETIIYDGVMDEHMVDDQKGNALQTSSYIISIPLVEPLPQRGDVVTVETYGNAFSLEIDNVEPSQLGGVSIYASRQTW